MSQVTTEYGHDVSRVQEFLDQLAHAVVNGHGEVAAAMWAVPALVLGDEMALAVKAVSELEPFFTGARAQYNQRGVTGTRAEIIRLDWLTERIAQVEVRWPWLDAQGQEVGEETSTYVLRADDSGALKLRCAIMHGARLTH